MKIYTLHSILDIVQWFKTMTTNQYIIAVKTRRCPKFDKHFWQRSFYDRIIRNEKELFSIREYIQNNPAQWENEREHHEMPITF